MDPTRNATTNEPLTDVPIPSPIHVSVHYVPELGERPEKRQVLGEMVECITMTATQADRPFPSRFDGVLADLDQQLNAYVEGDGSFVFTGRIDDDSAWRVNGTLYEANDQIQNVELWIDGCPRHSLERALAILGVQPDQCVYQLLTAGVFLTHDSFCQIAGLRSD